MSFSEYLNKLVPNFERTRIADSMTNNNKHITLFLEPKYEATLDLVGKRNLVRPAKLIGVLGGSRGDNHLARTHSILKKVARDHEIVIKLIDQSFEAEVATVSISIPRLVLLRYTESILFFTAYARRLLNLTVDELLMTDGNTIRDPSWRREEAWLLSNARTFLHISDILDSGAKDLTKVIDKLPTNIVSHDDVETTMAAIGRKKADPLKLGFIPIKLNPIYLIRSAYTQIQVHVLNMEREEIELLTHRIESLRIKRAAGGSNAKLEEQIEYYSGRVDRLRKKHMEMADDAGL